MLGGCVRDSLLGIEPKDWDITTNARPEEVKQIFTKIGVPVIPTGEKHGTLSLLLRDTIYEVTTYRSDGKYSDGRHADEVKFEDSLEKDLSRRDFTINAIAADINGEVVDPFNGIIDLQAGIIRTVGDANQRFSEDYLRILRACRFAVKYGFLISELVETAIYTLAPNLNKISKERLYDEFMKIFDCKGSSRQKYLISYVLQVCVNSCLEGVPIHFQVDEQECGVMLSLGIPFEISYATLFRNVNKNELKHLINLFSFTRIQKERIRLIHMILNLKGDISDARQQRMILNAIAIRNIRIMSMDEWVTFLSLLEELHIHTSLHLDIHSASLLLFLSEKGMFSPDNIALDNKQIQQIINRVGLLPHYHRIVQNILVNAVALGAVNNNTDDLQDYLNDVKSGASLSIIDTLRKFNTYQEELALTCTEAELKLHTAKIKSYLSIFSLVIPALPESNFLITSLIITQEDSSIQSPILKVTGKGYTVEIEKSDNSEGFCLTVVKDNNTNSQTSTSYTEKLDVITHILTLPNSYCKSAQSPEIQGF